RHPSALFIPGEYRIKLPFARQVSQIATVFGERLKFLLRFLVRDPLTPANRGERRVDAVFRRSVSLEYSRPRPADIHNRQEQMLGTDIVVVQALRVLL